ncbi:MAG: hypothetical protein PHD82_09695 [Candidatus Riflebacteria bacterium]|nr:hypothetical protein [Candidatus Riflebacteria bacterium]
MKTWKSLIRGAVAGLLVLLFVNVSAGMAQETAYRSSSRPLDNYLKVAAAWAAGDEEGDPESDMLMFSITR